MWKRLAVQRDCLRGLDISVRESLRDGVYSVPGFLIVPAGKSNARFVGHRPGTEVRWQANRHLCSKPTTECFTRGNLLRRVSQAANLNYWHCGPAISLGGDRGRTTVLRGRAEMRNSNILGRLVIHGEQSKH